MANVFDYLDWRGDLDLAVVPFNDVDALILAGLSYLAYAEVLPVGFASSVQLAAAAEPGRAVSSNPAQLKGKDLLLLEKTAASRRFGRLELCAYRDQLDQELEMQFSAVTFRLSDELAYLSFRGTGDPLVGWKEDFKMSYMSPVPAQQAALEYLRQAAQELPGRLLLGGHSKGGNLAVFAAAKCEPEVQQRLAQAYSFDGPGFQPELLDSPGYQAIEPLLASFIPQASIVGLLLGNSGGYSVVSSVEPGLFQHSLYDWEVTRDSFVVLEKVSAQSRYVEKTLNTWLAGLDNKQREVFFNALFETIAQTETSTISEMGARNWLSNSLSMLKGFIGLDEQTRAAVLQAIQLLFQSLRGHVSLLRKDEN